MRRFDLTGIDPGLVPGLVPGIDPGLVADCARCAALCCVWSTFDASDDFAFSKPAGVACPNLRRDCRCAVHDELAIRGLGGCAAYDCHGAGPRATRLFAGAELTDRERHDVFAVLRDAHELLWLLGGAARLCPPSHGDLQAELVRAVEAVDAVAAGTVAALLDADLRPHRAEARQLLRRLRDALGGRRCATLPVR
jgi:hypothetical protein